MGARETAYTRSGYLVYYSNGSTSAPNPACPTTNVGFRDGKVQWPCDQTHYWSYHPNGGNFLMADASVQYRNYSFDAVLVQASTRSNGEVYTVP
jgi:prepilin-type processing-associated H-X9-DG protein